MENLLFPISNSNPNSKKLKFDYMFQSCFYILLVESSLNYVSKNLGWFGSIKNIKLNETLMKHFELHFYSVFSLFQVQKATWCESFVYSWVM